VCHISAKPVTRPSGSVEAQALSLQALKAAAGKDTNPDHRGRRSGRGHDEGNARFQRPHDTPHIKTPIIRELCAEGFWRGTGDT
jgi:hypothetical protein